MKKTRELFDAWNERKKEIEFVGSKSKLDVRVGEFWWYREGVNIGNEMSKDGRFKRMGIVLKTNWGNGLILVAPLTTKYHARMDEWYTKVLSYKRWGLKESWVVLNQVKLIDKKRFSDNHNIDRVPITFGKYILRLYQKLLKQKTPHPKMR